MLLNYRKENEIPIYTCSSSEQKPITYNEFTDMNIRYGVNWPTIRAVWYISFSTTNNRLLFMFLNTIYHIIPGYILDGLAILTGQKPMYVII